MISAKNLRKKWLLSEIMLTFAHTIIIYIWNSRQISDGFSAMQTSIKHVADYLRLQRQTDSWMTSQNLKWKDLCSVSNTHLSWPGRYCKTY